MSDQYGIGRRVSPDVDHDLETGHIWPQINPHGSLLRPDDGVRLRTKERLSDVHIVLKLKRQIRKLPSTVTSTVKLERYLGAFRVLGELLTF
jgi:hypothetical protein